MQILSHDGFNKYSYDIANLWAGLAEDGQMSITRLCRKFIRKTLFGDALLPQAFTIGLVEPQTEIAVWLHGMGTPIDVTYRHSMACADPFTVCIAFDEGRKPSESERSRLTLWFCEQDGQKRILGKIVLGPPKPQTVSAADREFILFEARSSANYCLSRARTWAYYLLHRYSLWRKVDVARDKDVFFREASGDGDVYSPSSSGIGEPRG